MISTNVQKKKEAHVNLHSFFFFFFFSKGPNRFPFNSGDKRDAMFKSENMHLQDKSIKFLYNE